MYCKDGIVEDAHMMYVHKVINLMNHVHIYTCGVSCSQTHHVIFMYHTFNQITVVGMIDLILGITHYHACTCAIIKISEVCDGSCLKYRLIV